MKCLVCDNHDLTKIYVSKSEKSVTSLAKILDGKTEVFLCKECSHCQTRPISDLKHYYSYDYNILTGSSEEDQLYVNRDGTTESRIDYQRKIVEKKVTLPQGAMVLDYGCGKASTLNLISKGRPDIVPLCYDVSTVYLPFWGEFVDSKYCFSNKPVDESLEGKIDCITSFFSLEHAESPKEFLLDISRLLKMGGKLICVIPNLFENWADLVVVDHINHFTALSIEKLFSESELSIESVDSEIYVGAYVIVATKNNRKQFFKIEENERAAINVECHRIASYWARFSDMIMKFEEEINNERFSVYGAGFYGVYIGSLLSKRPENYIDKNIYLVGKKISEIPIVSLKEAKQTVENIIVALNPQRARTIIEKDVASHFPKVNFMYLDN